MGAGDFWASQERAQTTVSELKTLKARLEPVTRCDALLDELDVMLSLVEEDRSEENLVETERMAQAAEAALNALEFRVMLDGEYDVRNAFLSVQAGAGGTESCDWAAMLLRMYARWAERMGYQVEVIDRLEGEEAGIKSCTLLFKGHNAYGKMKTESGVHRLVRISPYDSNARRHTSFASVWAYPVVDDEIDIQVNESDVKVDTYRASGAGGQHVNTTDSAVRLTHMPTGIIVACQAERSQHKNRATAWKMLKARLYELELQKQQEKIDAANAKKTDIGWGHQIRSYVLQPYQLVKDLRTGFTSTSPASVLDGDLDDFIQASLAHRIKGGGEAIEDIE